MKNKNIKLIVSDFDGTLVDERITASPRVSDAIKKWTEKGNIFSIATGRQYLMIKKECERLGLKNPIIVRGGAEIVNPETGKFLLKAHMKKDSVERLIPHLQSKGLMLSIEKDNFIYSDFYHDVRFKDVLTYLKIEDFVMQDVPKVVAHNKSGDGAQVLEVVKNYPELHVVEIKMSAGVGWDITSLAATKHLGILELIKLVGLSPEQVAGIGDGYNDFPLLEACGLKVAMGNAVEELKEIADLVVPSQKEDGVAFLIEKLLKENEI